jgi:hypothetical protein
MSSAHIDDKRKTMHRSGAWAALIVVTAAAPEAAAQSLTSDVPAKSAAISVTGKVAGKDYHGSGGGSCRHADEASIHDVSAAVWVVEYSGQSGSLKQLSLTLWRPKDGSPDQLSLSLETGSASHRIQTGGKEKNKGQASVAILPSGPGGTLEIKGTEAKGKPVQLTIECPLFGNVESADR